MIVGPDYDAVHKRLLAIEKQLDRMESNPAPTIPQYDLEVPPPGNYYLKIWGDRYNNLPGIFNIFSDQSQSDVWMRLQWMNPDISILSKGIYVATLVFTEWITDPYYYGTGSGWGYQAIGFAISFANNLGLGYGVTLVNNGGASDSGSSTGGNLIGTNPVIDLHVARTGLNANRGGDWSNEIFVDGVLRWSGIGSSYGDLGPPTHPLGRDGIGGMVFGTQYGNYVSPAFLPIDNVMCGTSQGTDDLMSIATFDGGSFGPFDDSLNIDTGDGPSFEVAFQAA